MWTDERVELLKKLWADGLSASRIAVELGGITRNAVIGKVHRLGLSGRGENPPPPGNPAPHTRPPFPLFPRHPTGGTRQYPPPPPPRLQKPTQTRPRHIH